MKKWMVLLPVVVFEITLAMPTWGAEAQMQGTQPGSQQQGPTPYKRPTQPLQKQASPDLIVESIRKQVLTGDNNSRNYEVVITVKNIGEGHAGPFNILVEKQLVSCQVVQGAVVNCNDGQWEAWPLHPVSGLSSGATTLVFLHNLKDDLIPSSGNYSWWRFRATADSRNDVAESNENNNQSVYNSPAQY